jgi:hypothetical protein
VVLGYDLTAIECSSICKTAGTTFPRYLVVVAVVVVVIHGESHVIYVHTRLFFMLLIEDHQPIFHKNFQ